MNLSKRAFWFAFFCFASAAFAHYEVVTGIGHPVELRAAIVSASFAVGPGFGGALLLDRYLWRFRFVRKLLGVSLPYVAGRWVGAIRSTHTQHEISYPVVLEIWQTLSTIECWYYDQNAVTRPLISGFIQQGEAGPHTLLVLYQNRPVTNRYPNLQAHEGVMDLIIDNSSRVITGTYFNNPFQRATFGEIRLTWLQRGRTGSFSGPGVVEGEGPDASGPKYGQPRPPDAPQLNAGRPSGDKQYRPSATGPRRRSRSANPETPVAEDPPFGQMPPKG